MFAQSSVTAALQSISEEDLASVHGGYSDANDWWVTDGGTIYYNACDPRECGLGYAEQEAGRPVVNSDGRE
ncbi:MAG: hypothetical protein U0235_01485 [Polyangiaceae bacterium]